MPQPDDIVDGDIIVREFSGRFLIFRFHGEQRGPFSSSREGLGESEDRDQALSKAFGLARNGHAVWLCDTRESYRKLSLEDGLGPGPLPHNESKVHYD